MKKIRILLTDDHSVLRAGLKALLNAESDMEVVGEAADGQVCIRQAALLHPDVVLLDINMPTCNGLEALETLSALAPDSRVLVLTMHDDLGYLRQVLASGGAGYVLKQAASDELLTAIRTVHSGGVFLHSAHAKNLLEKPMDETVPSSADADPLACLSERELEVVRQVGLGHSNKEIAGMLYLSVKTVETYKARAMEKLNLRSRAALVRVALQQGLLDEAKL